MLALKFQVLSSSYNTSTFKRQVDCSTCPHSRDHTISDITNVLGLEIPFGGTTFNLGIQGGYHANRTVGGLLGRFD